MSRKFAFATAAVLLSAPMAMADGHITGDAAAGEAAFRQCATCHNVVDAEGNVLAGRPNSRTGPNLYGIAGSVAGSVEGFRYSPGLTALNEAGHVWDEAGFAAYIVAPTDYIRETTGDGGLRGAMANQRLRGDTAAQDLYAYLASLADAPAHPPAE